MALLQGINLPRRGHLSPTGPVDWIRKYEAPGIGFVFRRRLTWAAVAQPIHQIASQPRAAS